MSDAIKRQRALKVFETLCAVLDGNEWKYERDDEKLIVRFGLYTEDLPVHYVFIVDEERQMLRLASPMAFTMEESKRTEGAIVANGATASLRDGCFDYDLYSGRIVFRLTASFLDSEFGADMIHYFIRCTNVVVDHYNDKFEAVNNGTMSVQDFLAAEQ
ncbi:MAG: hypothetical protein IJN04_01340 [Clostridia bacterium]|nr:hypothetical protein [Clostridia bacterium]